MEEKIFKVSQETLDSLKKSQKLPLPLYYKEVFAKLALEDEELKNKLDKKVLCLETSVSENFLKQVEESLKSVSSATKDIKDSSQEIVSEIQDVDSEELKELLLKFNSNLVSKLNEMEEKVNVLEKELNNTYKELLIDPLTKAYNRKSLEKDLKKILERGKDRNLDLVVAIIDMDDFKFINDTYGHIVGDYALIKLVSIIKSLIRSYDRVYRYGGDEFVLILNRISKEVAEKVLQRIIQKIQKTKLKYKDNLIPISLSIGATVHKKGDTLESIIKRADEALYKIKKSTKNGYCIL